MYSLRCMALVLEEMSPSSFGGTAKYRTAPGDAGGRGCLLWPVAAGGRVLPPEPVIAGQDGAWRAAPSVRRDGGWNRMAWFGASGGRALSFTGMLICVFARGLHDAFALVLPDTQSGYYPSLLSGFEAAAGGVRSQVLGGADAQRSRIVRPTGFFNSSTKKSPGTRDRPSNVSADSLRIKSASFNSIRFPSSFAIVAWMVRAPVLAFSSPGCPAGLAAEAMLARGHNTPLSSRPGPLELAGRYELFWTPPNQWNPPGSRSMTSASSYLETDAYTDAREYEKRMEQAITRTGAP